MPKLRLPPLPPTKAWADILTKTSTARLHGILFREAQKRTWIANPTLTNRFVRDLGIRKGEVIIEAYSGLGQLTRALLAGGMDETTPKDWEKVRSEQKVVGPEKGSVHRRNAGQFTYPSWNVGSAPMAKLPEPKEGKELEVPSLVVANEPAISLLSRGLGFLPDMAPPGAWDFSVPQSPEVIKRIKEEKFEVYPSILEKERLVFAPESAYHWGTLPKILNHKLVTDHLPVFDETKEGVERYQRPWTAPPPPITLTVIMQDSTLGEQLLNQWVSSAIGSSDMPHSWIWKWGRIRLAFLLPRQMYDRLMAQDGEGCRCKLSVMAGALFKLRPLTPFHHVPDADKGSMRTDTSVDHPRPGRHTPRTTIPAPPPTTEVTETVAGDFFPISPRLRVPLVRGKARPAPTLETPLERPALLGLELVPRDDTPLLAHQREVWEFLLRKMFVREAATVRDVLPTLAFGADNLLPKLENEGESPYAGMAVSGDTVIRNIHELQWLRLVDVFDNWAFKPDVLPQDMETLEESREVGMS